MATRTMDLFSSTYDQDLMKIKLSNRMKGLAVNVLLHQE